MEKEIKGGLADDKSVSDIAKKFKVSIEKIQSELDKGIEVEMEHVDDPKLSKDIAMDHLVEIPDYYSRLAKMEKDAIDESYNDYIKRVIREQVGLKKVDETPITTGYDIYYNGKKAGVLEVGNFNKTLPEDAIELVLIKIDEEYRGINLAFNAIKAIWQAHPEVNTIYLMTTADSRGFWEKIGAKRLNNTYHIIQKGH
jgi:hypothetical protein